MTRVTFPISCVLCTKTHADNCHLLGFIGSGGNDLMCYVFESNADGNDVCCAINTANAMEQSKVCWSIAKRHVRLKGYFPHIYRFATYYYTTYFPHIYIFTIFAEMIILIIVNFFNANLVSIWATRSIHLNSLVVPVCESIPVKKPYMSL